MFVNDSSLFVLTAYMDLGVFRLGWFVLLLLLYGAILGANVVLVLVIAASRDLRRPMFLLLCSLFVNELWGSSALFPFLLVQLIQESHTVPAPLCFLQIFCVYTYASIQFSNLAAMSYDRYLAICCPLLYQSRMTPTRVALLILFAWLYPFVAIFILISLSSSLKLCGNVIHKVYCDNFSIVKLSCSNTLVSNVYGIVYTCSTVAMVLLNFYSYGAILRVVYRGPGLARQKAVSTCTPHLLALLNFSCGCFFEIIQNRFDMSRVPSVLRIVLSLYFLTCPPLFHPLLYGLNVAQIRVRCQRIMWRRKDETGHNGLQK
ncbi:olfactory receptor 11A1-like [Eucyclogobius newberryi]|uniref:olfactory receptor 11A1-like n=1 Tax=Eucyclogobius newberryi TaxID=166745 RepID=UPI003B5C656B